VIAEIRTTADVVAASICWLARWRSRVPGPTGADVSVRHPGRCPFCGIAPAILLDSIEEFRVVDGADHAASAEFLALSAGEQRGLVDQAFGLTGGTHIRSAVPSRADPEGLDVATGAF
jgi:hypothetical protein